MNRKNNEQGNQQADPKPRSKINPEHYSVPNWKDDRADLNGKTNRIRNVISKIMWEDGHTKPLPAEGTKPRAPPHICRIAKKMHYSSSQK